MLINGASVNDGQINGGSDVERPGPMRLRIGGGTPSLTVGQSLTPGPMRLRLNGGKPGVVILTPGPMRLRINGNTPTFGLTTLPAPAVSRRRFEFTLTGSPDIVIPISSLTGNVRQNGVSSLTVVVPDGVTWASEIAARAANGFYITATDILTDGSEESTTWPTYAVDTIRTDRGGRSYSVTIRGIKTLPVNYGAKIELSGISYLATQANGKTRVRCDLDRRLLPGDVALDDLLPANLLVQDVTYVITENFMYMELAG